MWVCQVSLLTVQCAKPFHRLRIQAAFIVKTSVNLSDLAKHLPKKARFPPPPLHTENMISELETGGVEVGNIAV